MENNTLGMVMPQIVLPTTKEEVNAIDFGTLYKWTTPTFSWPYEQLKAAIENILATYTAIDVTDIEDIDELKKNLKRDREYLNALKKKFAAMDSTIHKDIVESYNGYKERSKELQNAIAEAVEPIDEKVKEIETYWKEQKRIEITAFYNTYVESLENSEVFTEEFKDELYAKIFEDSWLNQTTSKKKYQDAIVTAVTNYVNGVNAIKAMNHEFEKEGLDNFNETLELSSAIAEMGRLASVKADMIAKEKAAMESAQAEALKKAEAEKQAALQAAEEKHAEEMRKLEAEKQEAITKAVNDARTEMASNDSIATTTSSTVDVAIDESSNETSSDEAADYISIKIPANKFELVMKVFSQFNIDYKVG